MTKHIADAHADSRTAQQPADAGVSIAVSTREVPVSAFISFIVGVVAGAVFGPVVVAILVTALLVPAGVLAAFTKALLGRSQPGETQPMRRVHWMSVLTFALSGTALGVGGVVSAWL